MSSWIFFRTSLVPSIAYFLVIKIGSTVFEKIRYFYFSKFVHNFRKKFFFELILRVNLSCDGNHLPSQYGPNLSGGAQTMLILLRPCQKYYDHYRLFRSLFDIFGLVLNFLQNKAFQILLPSFLRGFLQTSLADPAERTVIEYSDRSLTVLWPRIITAKNGKKDIKNP